MSRRDLLKSTALVTLPREREPVYASTVEPGEESELTLDSALLLRPVPEPSAFQLFAEQAYREMCENTGLPAGCYVETYRWPDLDSLT